MDDPMITNPNLSDLPVELITLIAHHTQSEKAISRFSQANHRLHDILTPYLYWQNSRRRRRGKLNVLLWAARHGNEATARLALIAYKKGATPTKPLFMAAKCGHISVVRLFLSREHIHIETAKPGGYTPLALAAMNGHVDVVRALVEAGASVDPGSRPVKGSYNHHVPSVILWAVEKRHIAVVRYLLGTGRVNIEDRNVHGQTLLAVAVGNQDVEIVRLLLESGADPNTVDDNRSTPLVWAARLAALENSRPRLELLRLLLAHGANNVLRHAQDQLDPVFVAITWWRAERPTALQMLLDHPAINFNYVNRDGLTALAYATRYRRIGLSKSLLARPDLDPNLGDALACTVEMGYREMMQELLVDPRTNRESKLRGFAAGVRTSFTTQEDLHTLYDAVPGLDVNQVDSSGQTFLMRACAVGSAETVRTLIHEWGADPGLCPSPYAEPPLFVAAMGGDRKTVRLLLETKRVDVDWAMPGPGLNALHMASVARDIETIRILVEEGGADINAVDRQGQCALTLAITSGMFGVEAEEIVTILLAMEGIDPGIRDLHGRTPVDHASERGEEACVALILSKLEEIQKDQDEGSTALPIR